MCFVSKKKYDALLEQKKDFERIATNAVTQNGRLLEEWDAAIKEMKSIQALNEHLVKHNDVLVAYTKDLETKLSRTTEHVKLADDTIFDIEDALYRQKGDDIIQLHIDEYYEEVRFLDTK